MSKATFGLALIATTAAIALILTVGCPPPGENNTAGSSGADTPADGGPPITAEEMVQASDIYFDRCSGCHGTTRLGATGPALTPDLTRDKGHDFLVTTMTAGTIKGMPDWGAQGILSADDIDLMSRFLQHEPPPAPEVTLDQIQKSHKLVVPVDQRPTAPPERDWEDYFGVILRDVGKVAIIDGETKEMLSIINTGFAVHILRSSATGRYFYAIGRDGKATMIDLWMDPPALVAEVKCCNDARSLDTSKFEGYEDRYVIVGGYWPPSMIFLDGLTLEPIKVVSTSSYTYDSPGEYLREARVASIVSSHHDPIWVVNIKETGQVWLVDYSKLDRGTVSIDMIAAERFLHDGGWDSTKRYFLVAANARDKVSVIDTYELELVANVPMGTKPHPGRGINIDHPEYGPIWGTGHLGDNTIRFIGTDPDGHADNAWKEVRAARIELPGEGGGNLFIKTHPNSNHIWADRPLHTDVALQRSVHVIDKDTLEVIRTIEIPEKYKASRAVHLEYNRAGTEMWVAVWGNKETPTAMLVYDDETLELTHEITGDWCRTPTGHFNVWNTTHDVY